MTVHTSSQLCQENEQMEHVSSSVRVVVRVRPQNELEQNGHYRNVVEVMNENVLVFDPKEEASPLSEHRGKHRDIRKRRVKDLKFAFDYVFGPDSTNEELFKQTTVLVLDGLLSGYNCSVFAYGATGSGKTHTMLGNQSHPGVIYHTMIQLYQRINEISPEKTCDVAVSYLEVYNEQIRDLLLPRGTLPIREDRSAGIIIPGLSLHKPQSAEELLHMLQFGNKNRTQHPTDANAESSRSHAVFQVFVRQRDRTAGLSAEVKVAKMCLVDLAGSERATVTKNLGARFREGANINRSLLALGNVINALADQKYKGHIPYRDSKLTRLLKDSLGGNCRTIMIAAVSPSGHSYEDTYNTLKYADRAKNIRLNMKKNVLSVDFHVSRYGQIVEELRKEIRELKVKLQESEEGRSIKSAVLYLPPDLQALKENLSQAYAQCRQVREEQLQQETNVRDVQWRLHRKHKTLQRAVCLSTLQPQVQHKIQAAITGLQQKLVGQEARWQLLSAQLQDKASQLQKVQAQANSFASVHPTGSLLSQYLTLSMHSLALEGELQDARYYIHHLRRLARAQERESQASEWLISALLKLVHKQQTHLMTHGPLPSDVSDSLHNLSQMLGESSVCWAEEEVQVDDSHSAFHIGGIINIPSLSVAGLQMLIVPKTSQPDGTPTEIGGAQRVPVLSKTNSVTWCPGPVIGGKVAPSFPAVQRCATPPICASSTKLPPSLSYNARLSVGPMPHPMTNSTVLQKDPEYCRAADGDHLAVVTVPGDTSVCSGMVPSSRQRNVDSTQALIGSPTWRAENVYAGHTPGHKKDVERNRPCSRAVLQHPTHKHDATTCTEALDSKLKLGAETVSSRSLNETFCVDKSQMSYDSVGRGDSGVDSTLVLPQSSLLTLPVVNTVSSPAQTHKRSQASSSAEVSGRSVPVASHSRDTHCAVAVCDEIMCGTCDTITCWTNGSEPPCVPTVVGGTVTKKHPSLEVQTTAEQELDDKENKNILGNPLNRVVRAIKFDDVLASPVRAEMKSYAEAVKTPSPARPVLQSLDCNSPQVLQAKLLSSQLSRTTVTVKPQVPYPADIQVYDTVRQLKQFGMPSLMENHVKGTKPASVSNSKPSYMLPTKSVAQRHRLQQKGVSKDDAFETKQVSSTNLSHVRSKSATNLARTGWKF